MTPVFQLQSTKDMASQGSLSQLSSHLRMHGKPDRCPECGMQCKPMYIARHACKQHAWIKAANSQVVEWAKQSQIPSNPCQWCGTQFKTSNKAHRNACPVLWMCGQLLHRYSSLTPSSQGALHDYGWSRGTSASGRGAQQLPELHGAESGHPNYGSEQPSPGDARGQHLQKDDHRRRRGGHEGKVAQGARQGDTANTAQAKRRAGPAAGAEELVGGPARQSGLQQRQRFEIGCQSARQVGSQAGRQLVGDPAGLPVCHLYEEPQAGNNSNHRRSARLDGDVTASCSGEPLEVPERARPQELVSATQNRFAQLLVDSDSVQDRRAFEQASNQGDCHGHGHLGERPLPLHAMESRGVTACQSGSSSSEHHRCPADHHAVAATDNPSQHDWEVPPVEAVDSGDGERCDPLDARDPKPNTRSPSSLPAYRQTGSKRGDPPCSLHSPPEQAGTLSAGNSGGQNASGALRPVQSALLQLTLVNPNSFSYANASLISVLWASSCSQVGLCVHHAGLFKFLQWLASQRKPQPIWDNIVFRNVIRDWQQPGSNHLGRMTQPPFCSTCSP